MTDKKLHDLKIDFNIAAARANPFDYQLHKSSPVMDITRTCLKIKNLIQ
jgi:hypothetical protein